MDSSNMIGKPSWNPGFSPLRAPEGDGRARSRESDANPALLPGDRLDLHADLDPSSAAAVALPGPAPSEAGSPVAPTARPSAPVPPRESVPVSMLAEDVPTLLGEQPHATPPLSGLGVLAQLDDVSLLHRMRAIDDRSDNGRFQEFSLIGPGNAARFLAHPEEMYLSI